MDDARLQRIALEASVIRGFTPSYQPGGAEGSAAGNGAESRVARSPRQHPGDNDLADLLVKAPQGVGVVAHPATPSPRDIRQAIDQLNAASLVFSHAPVEVDRKSRSVVVAKFILKNWKEIAVQAFCYSFFLTSWLLI